MKQYTKQIRNTLALLSSMARSGEDHSNSSEKSLQHSWYALEQLDSYIDSNHSKMLITPDQAIDYEVYSHWLASWIWFDWGHNLLGHYFAWKVRRKYRRYQKFKNIKNSFLKFTK